ncbi:MAG: hypothetical protein HND56_10640 [Pseudomonadota bacterium]|nr:hypothetical protein [Pseudomonadota bacterium]QKK06115.1 MAG: hypothetical protein HND56_10640 [Pseudomonadota bacterium]
MSLFKRFSAVFLCTLLLATAAGCGFSPLYAVRTQTAIEAFRDITIANIPERAGQQLRNLLIDKLYGSAGPSGQNRYRLVVNDLQERETSMGVQKDATVTRIQLRVSGEFILHDLHNTDADGNPAVVLQRRLRTLNSYNVLDNLYATRISRQNILDISLNELADQAVTELSLFLKRQENGQQ